MTDSVIPGSTSVIPGNVIPDLIRDLLPVIPGPDPGSLRC